MGAYGAYALVVIVVAYILAFIDRQILNLLVEPIKHDLGLSDTEISLLHGMSFAIVLSIAGLPLGRLVDTRRRVTVLSIGITIWTILTAGCGLSRSYLQLLLCRMGVGFGEAAMTPTAYSLIGDYFPPEKLGMAAGFYSVGGYVGTGLALIFGGAISAMVPAAGVDVPILGLVHGWQVAFLIIGPAGLAVALWVGTLVEPPRRDKSISAPAWAEVRGYFKKNWASVLRYALRRCCWRYAEIAWHTCRPPSCFGNRGALRDSSLRGGRACRHRGTRIALSYAVASLRRAFGRIGPGDTSGNHAEPYPWHAARHCRPGVEHARLRMRLDRHRLDHRSHLP
jgi:MFS family permease